MKVDTAKGGILSGVTIIESEFVPKGAIYFIGADTAVVAEGVEIPPPPWWVRLDRWLFARWWGAR